MILHNSPKAMLAINVKKEEKKDVGIVFASVLDSMGNYSFR